jgi:PAS domain S-box-containing protein
LIGNAEEYYRILFESISDGIIVFDRESNILEANQHFACRFGKSREEFIGTNSKDLFPADQYGDLFERRSEKLREAYDTGKTIIIEDARDDRWFSNHFYPIFNDGRVIAVALVSAEVTDRMKADKLLRDKLLLEKETELLREADKNKNELISVLAHEIRNPLATALTGITLYKRQNEEARPRTVEIIEKSLNQINSLVDDLLESNRITQHKICLEKSSVNLCQVLAAAADSYRSLFAEKQINLSVSLENGPVYVQADAGRLIQVFGNLLSNALKFNNAGGNVIMRLDRTADTVRIHVADDGIGISRSAAEKIFEPFFQENSALKKDNKGLGIGLYIVKGLVELHGGSITVVSDGVGKGAEFIVSLPAGDDVSGYN